MMPLISGGVLSRTVLFVLGVGTMPVGLAADQPVPRSDAPSISIPAIALPSDKVPGNAQPYLFRTDPNGQLVPNTPNTAIPTEVANVTRDQFLTFSNTGAKRIDTAKTGCDYYYTLRAVTGIVGCGANGELEGIGGNITFDKWKRDVRIDQYGTPGQTDTGQFINLVDLNLTRDHHMVSYGPNQLAAYVCNHAGPAKTAVDPTGLFPPQIEVNELIRGIASPDGLIACVAMEYSNRAQPDKPPFTMFFIFGPNGALLSTVDLDGAGPKGVPNVCTACHGGTFDYNTPVNGISSFDQTKKDLYYNLTLTGPALTQASNIRPVGDLNAHFLPFDKSNFGFSDKLTAAEQEEAIFRLNLDVYTTESSRIKIGPDGYIASGGLASASITDLISGWYEFKLTKDNPAPGFYPGNTVPPQWDYYNYNQIYLQSYAHSCRTCHVAMENAALERDPNLLKAVGASLVCTQHVMPNAKVTFDRFWLSEPYWTFPPTAVVPGQSPTAPNQPGLLNAIIGCPSYNSP